MEKAGWRSWDEVRVLAKGQVKVENNCGGHMRNISEKGARECYIYCLVWLVVFFYANELKTEEILQIYPLCILFGKLHEVCPQFCSKGCKLVKRLHNLHNKGLRCPRNLLFNNFRNSLLTLAFALYCSWPGGAILDECEKRLPIKEQNKTCGVSHPFPQTFYFLLCFNLFLACEPSSQKTFLVQKCWTLYLLHHSDCL